VTQINGPYADFLDRFAAFVADIIVVILLATATGLAMEFAHMAIGLDTTWSDDADMVFGLVIGWLYFAGMESSKFQATLGKLATGIMITDLEGNRASFSQASWRFVAKLISWMTFFIGFIVAAITPGKQAFHDFAANTIVVKKT
jgi:uncharacterized RDD family membrane protein YckC